jgi:hypothetical protein
VTPLERFRETARFTWGHYNESHDWQLSIFIHANPSATPEEALTAVLGVPPPTPTAEELTRWFNLST